MRILLPRISFLLAAAVSAAFAQNSDLGLLLGVGHMVNGIDTATVTSGSVSASGQINYAIQLHNSPGGRLYLELPLIITGTSIGTVAGGVSSGISESIFFFTPGVRYKFTPASRVSLYAAGGVGFAAVARSEGISGNGAAQGYSEVGATGAVDFGLGLDFRLTRLMSLRADAREDLSFAHVRGAYQHQFFMIGIGLHF
jgi:opacity protein-like surface antigen